mmetsp:Transcript_29370/g.61453  ORF Transcript_29370/g.61453 Transcript_29370/m.61453 type:complete len:88 (-) Transcript_29370:1180-1443(-)
MAGAVAKKAAAGRAEAASFYQPLLTIALNLGWLLMRFAWYPSATFRWKDGLVDGALIGVQLYNIIVFSRENSILSRYHEKGVAVNAP